MKNLFLQTIAIVAVAICFQTDAQAQSGTRGSAGGYAAPVAPAPLQSSVAPVQSQPLMMDKSMPAGSAPMHDHAIAPMADSHAMHDHAMHDHTMHDHTMAPATNYVHAAPAVHVQHVCPPSHAAPTKRRGFFSRWFGR